MNENAPRSPFGGAGGGEIKRVFCQALTTGFGLIDSYRVVRNTPTGRMSELQVRISDWMFKIIQGFEVLTLSRDYFRLRKPIERRIYEIARKHCGEQDEWRVYGYARLLQSYVIDVRRPPYVVVSRRMSRHDVLFCNWLMLQKKTGASSHGRAFRAMVRDLVEHDHLPDYNVSLDGDKVVFVNRECLVKKEPEPIYPRLEPET